MKRFWRLVAATGFFSVATVFAGPAAAQDYDWDGYYDDTYYDDDIYDEYGWDYDWFEGWEYETAHGEYEYDADWWGGDWDLGVDDDDWWR